MFTRLLNTFIDSLKNYIINNLVSIDFFWNRMAG